MFVERMLVFAKRMLVFVNWMLVFVKRMLVFIKRFVFIWCFAIGISVLMFVSIRELKGV